MKSYLKYLLPLLAIVALNACGGEDPVPVVVNETQPQPPPPPPPPAPVSVPQPDFSQVHSANFDYVLQYVVPQMQATYGDVEIIGDVYVLLPGHVTPVNIRGQILSWAQIYTEYVRGFATVCSCYVSVPGFPTYGSGFQGWAQFDYQGFNGWLSAGFGTNNTGYYNDWFNSDLVRFTRLGYSASFISVINTLVYSNYNFYYIYYTNYYYIYYPTYTYYTWPLMSYRTYYYNQWPAIYGYNPGSTIAGGFSYTKDKGDSRWTFGIGGFFNF
jgi:hypothetical protein